MSNGIESPLFLGKTQEAINLKEAELNSRIAVVRGTRVNVYPKNIHFIDINGNEISRISTKVETEFAPD